ncbi:hypothetical protein EB796_011097 [Bugula neritina]|uniref:CCHC-type domain-containing protein n=2 Tax=Bugula neritina TaxID=10212 RepID=A0A7J7JXH9_BUGNE|nr:hypothetical protein EB796_011097 [Bugula neritina]
MRTTLIHAQHSACKHSPTGTGDLADEKITKAIGSSDNCWTDHRLVKPLLSFSIQPTYCRVKHTPRPQFNVRLLQQPAVRQNLETKITKKLKDLPEDPNVDTHWTCLKSCITETCKAVLETRKLYGPTSRGSAPVKDKDSVLYKDKYDIRQCWKEHFSCLLNQNFTVDDTALQKLPQLQYHDQMSKEPSFLELIYAIKTMKSALTNFDLTESARCSQSTAMVFKGRDNFKPTSKRDKQCTACGKSNHSTKDCYSKHKLFCNYCKKAGHIESVCRTKKKTNKTEISSANATYAFTVNASNQCNIATQNKSQGGQ